MSRRLTFRPKDAHTVVLSGLDDFLSALLQELPEAGAPTERSEARLFPNPTGGREPGADADWRDFVRPELEEQFQWNRDRVAEDLKAMRAMRGGGIELDIPMAHLPAWIHALNQARLSLTEQHKLEDGDLEDEPAAAVGPNGLVLFQVRFYGLLQEWMLSVTESL